MLSRLYIMAVLLLLPLDSVTCSDYIETVANAFGRCSVSRIVEQLEKEEGSDLIRKLSTSSHRFKKIVRIDECDRLIMRWKENKVYTTVWDRFYYSRTCMKCLDLAIAAMDDLYKEARKDFKKLNASVTRMLGRPSKRVRCHTPNTRDEVNSETRQWKKAPPVHL